ncbi:unnamed protein product [Adineta ricciae]|uniref:Uncharacterized protein n=1 Tax=Adineta ricciae TaxID=249248 RepID=A0A813S1G9_ADIRI|nr:unnamed protein product [Adineta ricciae]
MASSQSKGRGRGRKRPEQYEPPPPSIPVLNSTVCSSVEAKANCVPTEMMTNQVMDGPEAKTSVSSDVMPVQRSLSRLAKSDELGTLGRKIEILVNYFPVLQFPQEGVVYRYTIEIRNKRCQIIRRNLRQILYQAWLKKFRDRHPEINSNRIIFDNQTTIFTYNQPLPNITNTETITILSAPNSAGRYEDYQCSIKQAGRPTDLDLLKSLKQFYVSNDTLEDTKNQLKYIQQIFSLVIHAYSSGDSGFIYNRTYFKEPTLSNGQHHWDLGLGKAVWRGFYSCLVFANGTHQLLMNLDVNHGIFQRRQKFLDFVCEVMHYSPCGRYYRTQNRHESKLSMENVEEYLDSKNNAGFYKDEIEFLLKHCKHVRVSWKAGNRLMTKDISDLGSSALEQTFQWTAKGNRTITVADYYREQYGIALKYPSLPILKMQDGLVVPMEVVDVEPVKVKKISDENRALLTRTAILPPDKRYQQTKDVCNKLQQQSFRQNSVTTTWGFQIDTKMHKLTARVLPNPSITFGNRIDKKFCKPISFPSVWGMINLSSTLDRRSAERFYEQLREAANYRGVSCTARALYVEFSHKFYSVDKMMDNVKNVMREYDDCHFYIVILSDDSNINDKIHGEIKQFCELDDGFGVITQMLNPRTIKRVLEDHRSDANSTLDNILLKINAKLNGINSTIQVPEEIERFFSCGRRIMYVGIDLRHSLTDPDDQRSIVTAVASADDVPSRYFKEIYIQNKFLSNHKQRIEYVVNMKDIMKSLIYQYFVKHDNVAPTAIVIYRDGISENEFDPVLEKEIMATREACVELFPAYQPCLTYIVVNRNHHTRFVLANSNRNIEAGTVIDSPDITNPATCDFYLKSHNYPTKGTSHPIHYHVLYDDNRLKPNEIQLLTYALCFTYARTTDAISIPTPVKYANLLSERTKCYLPKCNTTNHQCVTVCLSESLSKYDLDQYYKSILFSARHQIRSLVLSDTYERLTNYLIDDGKIPLDFATRKQIFSQITSLTLYDPKAADIMKILNYSSNIHKLYIFTTDNLRYISSSLTNVQLCDCLMKDLPKLLRCLPNIEKFSITCVNPPDRYSDDYQRFDFAIYDGLANRIAHLTHLTVRLIGIAFEEMECFLRQLPHLTKLTLTSFNMEDYVDGSNWKRVITTYLPKLEKFSLFIDETYIPSYTSIDLEQLMHPFNSLFWQRWPVVIEYYAEPIHKRRLLLYTLPVHEDRLPTHFYGLQFRTSTPIDTWESTRLYYENVDEMQFTFFENVSSKDLPPKRVYSNLKVFCFSLESNNLASYQFETMLIDIQQVFSVMTLAQIKSVYLSDENYPKDFISDMLKILPNVDSLRLTASSLHISDPLPSVKYLTIVTLLNMTYNVTHVLRQITTHFSQISFLYFELDDRNDVFVFLPCCLRRLPILTNLSVKINESNPCINQQQFISWFDDYKALNGLDDHAQVEFSDTNHQINICL